MKYHILLLFLPHKDIAEMVGSMLVWEKSVVLLLTHNKLLKMVLSNLNKAEILKIYIKLKIW